MSGLRPESFALDGKGGFYSGLGDGTIAHFTIDDDNIRMNPIARTGKSSPDCGAPEFESGATLSCLGKLDNFMFWLEFHCNFSVWTASWIAFPSEWEAHHQRRLGLARNGLGSPSSLKD